MQVMQDGAVKDMVTIVIPAFNEEKTIGDVVRGALANVTNAKVLVIDDGSTDDTSKEAILAGAEVIRHPINKGNGACLKTALRSTKGGIIGCSRR